MNKQQRLILLLIAIGLIILITGCQRQPAVPNYVYATGIGVPAEGGNLAQEKAKAKRAARLDAERQLLESLKGMAIDSTSSVQDFMLRNDRINSNVRGLMRGSEVVREGWNEDGAYEMELKIDFNKVKMLVR